ncbi:MAG: DUF3106 domain-containing protein, partial [Ferrovum sp.]|nr:DUF3106 domain-containing protein [Ferrovum sp.]
MATRNTLITWAFFFALSVAPAWAHEPGPRWDALSAEQQSILAPAQKDWDNLSQLQRSRLINAAK